MFDREQQGRYTMIFPFSQVTEDLVSQLNKQASGNTISINGPNHANYMKTLLAEIKQYYDDR